MPAKIKYLVTLLLLLACGASLAAEGTGLQLVQSLVLPGLSQVRHGRNYGYGMLTAEAALISSLLWAWDDRIPVIYNLRQACHRLGLDPSP